MCKRCQDGDVNGERQARCWQQPLVTVSVKMLIQIQHKHKYKCWGKAVGVVAWERCIGGDRKPLTRKLRWKELLAKPYNAVELWALPKKSHRPGKQIHKNEGSHPFWSKTFCQKSKAALSFLLTFSGDFIEEIHLVVSDVWSQPGFLFL